MAEDRLALGPFEIDRRAQVVLREGTPLPVGQRGVLLLEALLRRPGEVLTKGELMDAAWGSAAIEESNLSVQIAALRKTLGAAPGGSDWIVTVPRVGYRLVGIAEPPPAPRRSAVPSIAVLPFMNLSNDPDQSFFADGLAEEIITALAKLPDLLVIARNSSFAYRGDGIDVRTVGHELDVRYVLTGSVRRGGERLRMNVQLADAATGAQLWAESYDRQLADVFAIQDDVTRQVVGMLSVKLGDEREAVLPDTVPRDIEALDLFLRGRGLLSSPRIDRAMNREGIALLEEALRRAPTYVAPHVNLIVGLVTEVSNRWAADASGALAEARRVADRGVGLAPAGADIRAASALVAMLEKDHARLGEESGIAASLNPLGSFVNIIRGGYFVNDGQPRRAIPCYEQAIRADPGMTHLYMHHLATAYLFAGSHETAAALFRSRIVLSPQTDMSRAYLCVALGHLGRFEEARAVWADLMAINPTYSLAERLSMWLYRDPSYPQRLFEGLRRAGLPTGEAGS
jgi:TolB-like protein